MRAALAFILVLIAAAPGAGQSLFGTRGLGTPIEPVDARARALGGVGLGLPGTNPTLLNPAAPASVYRRGIIATAQPSTRSIEVGGAEDDADATRFPFFGVFLPLGNRVVASVGYGGFLDQTWAIRTEGTSVLGEDTVQTIDVVRSRGGIAQLRVGAAYRVSESFFVGLAGGVYTGSRTRDVVRGFIPDTTFAPLAPLERTDRRTYGAPLASLGARWQSDRVSAGASVTWAGTLEIDEADAPDREAELPLQFAGGTSATLLPDLVASISGKWQGWSVAEDDLGPVGASDAWRFGGGVEYTGVGSSERTFPVRLGGGYAQLPFPLDGEAPQEWTVGLGAGANFVLTDAGPLASFDATVERGRVGDAESVGLVEDFWRLSVSVSVFGQ